MIDNRTPEEVRFTLEGTGPDKREFRLLPGQLLPLHLPKKAVAVFNSEEAPRRQTLELNSIYSFQALPGGIELERTKFARKGAQRPAAPGPNPPQGPGDRPPPEWQASPAIPVKILVDDEQQATRQKWEADLRQAIKAASDVIERHCGLRFEVVAVDTWDSDDRAAGAGPLLADFEKKVELGPAWLAIGFTSQLARRGGKSSGTRRGCFPRTFWCAIGRGARTRPSGSSCWCINWGITWAPSTAPRPPR